MSIPSVQSGYVSPKTEEKERFEIEDKIEGKKHIFSLFGLSMTSKTTEIFRKTLSDQALTGSSGSNFGGGGWDVLGTTNNE